MKAEGIHSGKRSGRDDEGDLRPWQNASSRIIRVSRVSGGKDRHSKVWTVKGLRDRRVRLSVSTAIQFYDLQDRLGYDQPSKAVDWLIQAAADAIVELPELAGPFPLPPSVELPARYLQRGAAGEQHQHHLSQPKPACSSASETSKGSVLSFSRCEGVGKEKDQDQDQDQNTGKQSSFTELLAVGGSAAAAEEVDFGGGFDGKQMRHHPQVNSAADCFRQGGMFGQANRIPQFETGCSSLLHFGNSSIHPHMGIGMMAYNTGEHQDMQQFSFVQDHAIPVAALAPAGGDYNVNVSVSSGFAGFSRGTLQSNSPHQHQLVHGANLPFFLSATVPISAAAGGSLENQFPGGFNGRLQLCCNEAHRHPELKGERKG